jgi:DIX domain
MFLIILLEFTFSPYDPEYCVSELYKRRQNTKSIPLNIIRYFIPEDGDNEHQPNVFLAPKSRQQGTPPTLGQVKQAFPLPGKYHFRFKTALGGGNSSSNGSALAVWMDCIDDRQPVFVWKNQIIAKVTRTGIEDDEDDDDDDEDFRRPHQQQQQHQSSASSMSQQSTTKTPTTSSSQQQYPTPSQPAPISVSHSTSSPSFDIFDADHRPAPAAAAVTSGDLLGGHHHSTSSSGSSNLLDMNFGGGPSATPATHHNDFLGMTAAPSPPVSGNFNAGAFQQQMQQQPRPPPNNNQFPSSQTNRTTFDSFNSNPNDAFGGLGTPWK